MTGVRSLAFGLMVALLAALAGCGTSSDTGGDDNGSTLLVIGDSWVTGGTMNTGPTWPHLLDLPADWTVQTDAMGGSGYMGDEEAMSLTYAGRLDRVLDGPTPDVVIVAMGRNDVGEDPEDVGRVATEDLTRIAKTWPDARVVVFSPFSPDKPQPYTIALTDELEQVARALDMDFLDVSAIIRGRTRYFDSYHPNDRGHALIAEKVTAGLRRLGVIPQA